MASLAAANPALLPEHPGYPSRGEFTHDPGQKNLTHAQSLLDAAVSEDAHTSQNLVDVKTPTPPEPQGAGQLPGVHGVSSEMVTPVAGATSMPQK
jgi:hypothetical protein